MKKLFLASVAMVALSAGSSALAADMPVKARPLPPPPPPWSWSGFYIGVQGGGGLGTTDDNLLSIQQCNAAGVCNPTQVLNPPGLARDSYLLSGWHGGGTIGWNWQTGPIVFGVEGDISGSNIEGTSGCSQGITAFFSGKVSSCSTKMTWFATATGRLGFAIDHALLYVKAGGAWAHFDRNTNTGFVSAAPSGVAFSAPTVGENRSGFTFGAGIEYAFWGNWSAKLEYDYMDFGTKTFSFLTTQPPAGNTVNSTFEDRERVHVVRAGLNYRFNWGKAPVAVMAKY
jgi:outer membrane immunogenic protein